MNQVAGKAGLKSMQGALLAVLLVAAGWLATVAPNPPGPVPADAPAGDFSAERAFVHVRAIARAPHPLGSPANAAVREYVSSRLRALGLEPEFQSFPHRLNGQEVTGVNIMARLPGRRGTNEPASSVALVCHYDSVPTGPGASDDGGAVATLLETARALKSGPPLRNDVILLFTDGEEAPGGMPGAEAFVARCAWMKDIGLVLNFEARGVSGPVFMFETGPNNGQVIREFAKAAPRPVANSLMFEVYRRMPNDTDFSVFKHARMPGLNFAFIGDPRHYHAPTDDVDHFNRRCLQHQGSYAIGLARQFGNLNLAELKAPDAVYFDLFGRWLVHYPGAWAVPLAMLAVALFLAITCVEIKRREASAGKLVAGWLGWAANGVMIWVIFRYVFAPGGALAHAAPARFQRFVGWPYLCAGVGVTLALTATLWLALRRWLSAADLALGALAWWLILAVGSSFWLPGASYASLWPLLFGLAGVLAVSRPVKAPWARIAWLAATAVPTVVLMAPLIQDAFYLPKK